MQDESNKHRPHDLHVARGSSHNDEVLPWYVTRLRGVRRELLGKRRGIKERLCQEVAVITQQRARLIFHDLQSLNNIYHNFPSSVVTFPVEYDTRNFGLLAFQQRARAAEEKYPLSLRDIELLASTCGWLLDSLDSHALRHVVQKAKPLPCEALSKREREVLELMGFGSDEAIAQALDITVATVIRHRKNIFAKLGVSNEIEAILTAYHLHLYFPLEGILSKASESSNSFP
jgi:DNA-binding CsgD family transcriptional regulator